MIAHRAHYVTPIKNYAVREEGSRARRCGPGRRGGEGGGGAAAVGRGGVGGLCARAFGSRAPLEPAHARRAPRPAAMSEL